MEAIYSAWRRGSWDGRKLGPDWLMNTERGTANSFGKSIIFRYNKPFGAKPNKYYSIWKFGFLKERYGHFDVFIGKGSK